MKKKQKRRRHDPQTKAAAVARAQVVGLTQAGREIGCAASVVGRWAKKAGVTVPQFHFAPGRGLRRVEEPEAPGLGAGNPEPRPVTVTPPANKYHQYAADTPEHRAIALRIVRGEARQVVANEIGVSSTRISQIALALGPRVAAEHGIDWTPKSYPQRRPKGTGSGTLVSSAGRPPEQLAMYSPPTTPLPRVTAQPVRDEAEQARAQAQSEMLETALRQALRERDAFKLVHEVLMREKDPSR